MVNLIIFLLCAWLFFLPVYLKAANQLPQLMLSNTATLNELTNIENYWVSEKYDGVRAYWNGKQLLTRQGNAISAPAWFIAGLPTKPVEGELWIARQKFDLVSGIVRKKYPNDNEWHQIKFMLFDLPQSTHNFEQRQDELNRLVKMANKSWLQKVTYRKLTHASDLTKELSDIVESGAEGLMLNKVQSFYSSGRNQNLLKLKPYFDDEAVVLRHLPGKGKYNGLMGSLLVQNSKGIVFKIGTGFNLKQRKLPPNLGETITYKYSGLTKTGLPRFASFIRIRKDLDR